MKNCYVSMFQPKKIQINRIYAHMGLDWFLHVPARKCTSTQSLQDIWVSVLWDTSRVTL